MRVEEVEGPCTYSGSRLDRDYWGTLQRSREKDALQNTAHTKALKAAGGQGAVGPKPQGVTKGQPSS